MPEYTVIYDDLTLEHVAHEGGPGELIAHRGMSSKRAPAYVLHGFVFPAISPKTKGLVKTPQLDMLERIYEAEFGFGKWPEKKEILKLIVSSGGKADA